MNERKMPPIHPGEYLREEIVSQRLSVPLGTTPTIWRSLQDIGVILWTSGLEYKLLSAQNEISDKDMAASEQDMDRRRYLKEYCNEETTKK